MMQPLNRVVTPEDRRRQRMMSDRRYVEQEPPVNRAARRRNDRARSAMAGYLARVKGLARAGTDTYTLSEATELRLAREFVDRSRVLEPLRSVLDHHTGRPRALSVESLLVGMFINGTREGHNGEVKSWGKVLRRLTDTQLESIGVRVDLLDRPQMYKRVDDLFLALVRVLTEGFDYEVDGEQVRVDADWFANQIARAPIPAEWVLTGAVAVDGTAWETWAAVHFDEDSIELDGEAEETAADEGEGAGATDVPPSKRRKRRRGRLPSFTIGPDGRKVYAAADPEARGGRRTPVQGLSEKYVGYEFHAGTQVRSVVWTNYADEIRMGPQVPGFITLVALTPAGSHRADAVRDLIINARVHGQQITEVISDPGYSLCRAETWHIPMRVAGIDQVFEPVTHQRGQKPFGGRMVINDGTLLSALVRPEWGEDTLPYTRFNRSAEVLAEEEAEFNARALWRASRMSLADKHGRERFVCAFCAGRLVAAGKRVRTVDAKRRGKKVRVAAGEKCCDGRALVKVEDIPLWQRFPFGTTAWRVSYRRRQQAETSNSGLKGQFTNINEKFHRVMGRVKMLVVLAFTVAGYNFDRARAFAAKMRFSDPAEPALEDANAPEDKSLPDAPKVTYRREPEPVAASAPG